MIQSGNLRGIVLMVLSMAGFAIEDTFIKLAAADVPVGQILAIIGAAGAAAFAIWTRAKGGRVLTRDLLHPAVLLRTLGEFIGTFGFVTALWLVPISTLSAIFQAMPLAVTCGAALFLGETVGWRRWSAIAVAFAGVLVILRPGLEGFDPYVLFGVVAIAGLTIRDLATRRVPPHVSTAWLSAWGFATLVPLGLMMLGFTGGAVHLAPRATALVAGAVAAGILSYAALTAALRSAEAVAVTPFRYSRLVFALILGMIVFSERPDAPTLVGAALIIGSGLYAFAREKRIALTGAPA